MIWGTVLTTFFSNLLVPGLYVFRELKIDLRTYLKRTLSAPLAGAAALVAVTWALRIADAGRRDAGAAAAASRTTLLARCTSPPGRVAYIAGYLLVPAGRGDLAELAARLRRR